MNLVTELKKMTFTKGDVLMIRLKEDVSQEYQDNVFRGLYRMKKDGSIPPFLLVTGNKDMINFEKLNVLKNRDTLKDLIKEVLNDTECKQKLCEEDKQADRKDDTGKDAERSGDLTSDSGEELLHEREQGTGQGEEDDK